MDTKRTAPARQIIQEEIEILLGFEELIRQRQETYQRLYTGMLDRLRAGAAVENGGHKLELGPGGKYLVIDGAPHVAFLPGTPPRPQ